MMARQPDDPNWDHVQEEAAKQMETSRKECKFSPNQRTHRRGQFALSYEISYGGGQMVSIPSAFSDNNRVLNLC